MKFTVQKSILLHALSICARPIGKSTIPILDNFRFEITGNTLLITGSSMEVFISKEIMIESKIQSLDICFTAKKLLDYVKKLPDQNLSFTITNKVVDDKDQFSAEIKSSSGKCTIPLENGIDFPATPVIDSHEIEVPNQDLIVGFDKTTFATDTSALKVTANVLIQFGNGIQVTAANPYYLSTTKVFDNTINPNSIVMPKTALDIMTSIGAEGNTFVSYSANHICFKMADGTRVYSAITDHKYPDIKGFIEISCDKHISVNTSELKSALNRVVLFVDLINRIIKINLSDKGVTLSTRNEWEESAVENVSCEYSGESFDIGVISEQFLAVLGKVKSETIYLSFSEARKPILIKEEETESLDNVFLVIPCQLP